MKKQARKKSCIVRRGHRWAPDGWFWRCRSCGCSKRAVQGEDARQHYEFRASNDAGWSEKAPSCG